MLAKIKGRRKGDTRGRDDSTASATQCTWVLARWWDGEAQGSLACCSPWGREESDTTEWLNWTEQFPYAVIYWRHPDIWKFVAITSKAAVYDCMTVFVLTLFQSRFLSTRCAILILRWALFSFGKKQLSCSVAHVTFPDKGSNLSLLHCQAHSLPLSHHGSPQVFVVVF